MSKPRKPHPANKSKSGNNAMLDLLHQTFPGQTDEQVLGIGLIYAGVRWGRDFSAGFLPRTTAGQPIFNERDET